MINRLKNLWAWSKLHPNLSLPKPDFTKNKTVEEWPPKTWPKRKNKPAIIIDLSEPDYDNDIPTAQ